MNRIRNYFLHGKNHLLIWKQTLRAYLLADRIGIEKIYEAIENAKAVNTKPFEIGTNNGLLSKFVIRTQYDARRDISIVFYCSIKQIWTAWLNDSNDLHTTLDESKYADKSEWESECKFHYDNDV